MGAVLGEDPFDLGIAGELTGIGLAYALVDPGECPAVVVEEFLKRFLGQ
jgi:hypothetical protein